MSQSPAAALTPAAARRIFYLLTVTRWFPVGLVVGILVLLATGRGLTVAQALSYAAVSGIVTFALELPTSGFAQVSSGITAEAFLKAGAFCLGAGGSLVDAKAVAAGDYGAIRERAAQFAAVVARSRSK